MTVSPKPWCAALIAGVLHVLAMPALADTADAPAPAKPEPPIYAEIRHELDGRPEIWRRWKLCPADIAGENRAFWSQLIDSPAYALEDCEKDPKQCISACFSARNENACFELARAMQENTDKRYAHYWEAMFAQSCATGEAGGCTNRAAGIVNGGYSDDPFRKVADKDAWQCAYRSFEASCAADDAWGCTMLGYEYTYGRATAVDHAKATEAFDKSCRIDPDFVACDYAKDGLEGLKRSDADP